MMYKSAKSTSISTRKAKRTKFHLRTNKLSKTRVIKTPIRQQSQQNQPTQSKSNVQSNYTNIPISTWLFDNSLSPSAKSSLIGDQTIFFRPLFIDQIPPKLHQIGEISFPFQHSPSIAQFEALSHILCQSIIHQNYLPQSYFESFQSLSKQEQQRQHQLSQDVIINDICHLYRHQLQYLHGNNSNDINSQNASQSTIKPLPAYLLQGSFTHIKSFSQSLKQYLQTHFLLPPHILADLFQIPTLSVEKYPPLASFLQQRHLSLLSSFLLGRLIIALDSTYSPIHLIDLPTFPPHNYHPQSDSSQYQQQHQHQQSPQSDTIETVSDLITNVFEKQASNSIPWTFLPKNKYGQSFQNAPLCRATALQSIKLHHGFAEPHKPHPKIPNKQIATLAPLPTTLQQLPLAYILPLPFFNSILASHSSSTFSIPSSTTTLTSLYDIIPNPEQLYQNQSNIPTMRTFYGGFNNFVPTRIDYVKLFQQRFTQWSIHWLTSRSRLPQLNILDIGCGTGVLSLTALDLFHHLSTIDDKSYISVNHNSQHFSSQQMSIHTLLQNKRKQPFRINITSSDINPRSIATTTKNFNLLSYYQQHEPHAHLLHDSSSSSMYGSQYHYAIHTNAVQSNLFEQLPHPEPHPTLLSTNPYTHNNSNNNSNHNNNNQNNNNLSKTPFYDLIIFNPPWLPIPQRSQSSLDCAVYDNQFNTLTTFLQQCQTHLRSSQPFYQHLYRYVKGNTTSLSSQESSLSFSSSSPSSPSSPSSSSSSFNENNDSSSQFQKHQHVYEKNVSEVWIIISDLFQTLHLDQHIIQQVPNFNVSSTGQVLQRKFPQQSNFISYLEQHSGLTLIDIVETTSHNFSPNLSKSNSTTSTTTDLDHIRSQELCFLYILRDFKH